MLVQVVQSDFLFSFPFLRLAYNNTPTAGEIIGPSNSRFCLFLFVYNVFSNIPSRASALSVTVDLHQ